MSNYFTINNCKFTNLSTSDVNNWLDAIDRRVNKAPMAMSRYCNNQSGCKFHSPEGVRNSQQSDESIQVNRVVIINGNLLYASNNFEGRR